MCVYIRNIKLLKSLEIESSSVDTRDDCSYGGKHIYISSICICTHLCACIYVYTCKFNTNSIPLAVCVRRTIEILCKDKFKRTIRTDYFSTIKRLSIFFLFLSFLFFIKPFLFSFFHFFPLRNSFDSTIFA